ncbi:MAG: hypothetical protein ABIZ80_14265 [Bryobacteraceae bacterium]
MRQRLQVRRAAITGYDGMSPDGIRRAKTRSSICCAKCILHLALGLHDYGRGARAAWRDAERLEAGQVRDRAGGEGPAASFRIAIFHDREGFARLVEKGVPDVIEHTKGAEKTVAAATAYLQKNKPDLLFIHRDHAGHHSGHGTPKYIAAIEDADRLTGRMVADFRLSSLSICTLARSLERSSGPGRQAARNRVCRSRPHWHHHSESA